MKHLPAYLLVAALAWAVAARGGAGVLPLGVVAVLCLSACVVSAQWPPVSREVGIALGLLSVWLVIAGPVRAGPDLESARVPILLTVVVLAVQATRTLEIDSRATVLLGVTLVGCGQAVLAIVQVCTAGFDHGPVRVSGLVGSANGLGVLLVATLALVVRAAPTGRAWLTSTAVMVLLAALAATQSRTGIALGVVVLVGWSVRDRRRAAAASAVAAAATGVAVFWLRSRAEPADQRLHLWSAALDRIRGAPLAGLGPEPRVYSSTSIGRPTTHAHNEVLQLTSEYGTVGLALAVVLVTVVATHLHRSRGGIDRWLGAAAAVVLVAGQVDFTLRLTSMTLLAALVGTLSLTGPPRSGTQDPGPGPTIDGLDAESRRSDSQPPGRWAAASARDGAHLGDRCDTS